MPKVSVIVPIYNVEPYLRECIDSVLRQTYHDYELILVDDGSPDNCGAICDEYAAKDTRIQVIHKRNGGLSSARNAGLDIAKGKYIYFLDSDDTIDPELLQTVLSYMDQGADMVSFCVRYVYDDGREPIPRMSKFGEYTMNTAQERLRFLHEVLIQGKIGWEAWSRIFSRGIIEQYGLRFADNSKIFAEDLYFSLCYCAHTDKIVNVDACLYNYRQRETSIMGSQVQKCNMGRICKLIEAVLDHYNRHEDCAELVQDFPLIRYQLFAEQFVQQLWMSQMPLGKFKEDMIADIPDWDILERELKRHFRNRNALSPFYSRRKNAELRCHLRFALGDSVAAFRIRWKLTRMLFPFMDALER